MIDHDANRRSLAETARLTIQEFGVASSPPQSTVRPSIGEVFRANGITPRSHPLADDDVLAAIDADDLAATLEELDRL